jgi:hypothetical protein
MASIKTINFLPEVFRTDTNQKFLNATLDQLVTPPDLRKVNAYVGRKFAPTYKSTDNYQPEPSKLRQNYQLEPSVVVKDSTGNIDFFSSYLDLLHQLEHNGADITNQSRLFTGEMYSFDGLFDFDKFVNFNQYYWLPEGPDVVDVFGTGIEKEATYTVTRDTSTGSYHLSGHGSAKNPSLRLARGGTYKFIINQPGFPFWLQSSPGVSGLKGGQSNLSSRDVLGVENNGTDNGTITFTVPQTTAQDYYVYMPYAGGTIDSATVDIALDLTYEQIQNHLVEDVINRYGGLDGIAGQLNGKKVIFVNKDDSDFSWTAEGLFDRFGFDDVAGMDGGGTVPVSQRYGIWTIQLIDIGIGEYVISLVPYVNVNFNEKVYITTGQTYAENTFYLNPQVNYYSPVPNITASNPSIYYQDGVASGFVGEVDLVAITNSSLNVEKDIIGKSAYTSPNGVTLTNGLRIRFDAGTMPEKYSENIYFVEGVGTAIKLLDQTTLQTPELYLNGNGPVTQDYITINRASQDLNPWSRSNRWFHLDVIKAAAVYNNNVPTFNQTARANRPIIEFEADLQLYNFGRKAKAPVDIFDFTITDARNQVEMKPNFSIGNTALQNGMRVVFANDFDPTVRNQIFVVTMNEIQQKTALTLAPADDAEVLPYNNLIVLNGTNKGKEYWYNGDQWIDGQQKTAVNQTPMFDVVDGNGISIGTYADSTFNTTKNNLGTTVGGTPLFSYKTGTGVKDQVLGFPLSYRTFNQVGDIQFVNNYDSDTFSYTENNATVSANINTVGTLQQNTSISEFNLRNSWTTTVENSKQYQVISNIYDGVNNIIKVDMKSYTPITIPYLKVYKNFLELATTEFQWGSIGVNYYLHVKDPTLVAGDQIDIVMFGPITSGTGYYQIPENLDFNSTNMNFDTLTLGQLRNHLVTLVSNSKRVVGTAFGNNNLRDTPIKQQGGNILQHASPVLYSEIFLVDPDVNFAKGLELARHNYGRFKNKILELAGNLRSVDVNNIPTILDNLLQTINSVKNNTFPWYYSDMVPYGPLKNTITYTVINPEQTDYEITTIFSDTTLSNKAVLVYINNVQLTKGIDYVFDTTRTGITFIQPLVYGDVIVINEYSNTDGNFIPETPTKLGLYPKFTPQIYLDETFVTPIQVIQGHDGSVTPSFGDFRDQLLLEFELRIYNNIKVDYRNNVLNLHNFKPGKFRQTFYSNTEFTQLLTKSFLQWVGANRVDFTNNTYFQGSDEFTWNFGKFADNINGELLPGTWRAIFDYFYDTVRPNTHPWEMLGFGEKPSWWETRYGPAPYTGGNLVLWQDLAKGYVWNNGDSYIDRRYVRSKLLDCIPVDENGQLRNLTAYLVTSFNSTQANASYSVGQQGPVEAAWRRSSDYPYAVQQALAMANPAYYFGSLLDVSRYYKNKQLNQYVLTDTLQRITPDAVRVNGQANGTDRYRVAGYINWIADYLQSIGIDPVSKITGYMNGVDVQLGYKMAGFSDTSFIEVLAEQASPTSTTNSVVIPKENYKIEMYKSTPIRNITYSAVIVEVSENGYTVSGYDTSNPYFTIIPSVANNNAYTITSLNESGTIYRDYEQYKVTVPYGYEFSNKNQVIDFLVSYERFLTGNGIVLGEYDNNLGEQRDFKLSAKEFLTWIQQGWKPGSVLVLSPVVGKLVVSNTIGVVDKIENTPLASRVLDTGFNFIKYSNLTVTRTDNNFTLTATAGQTIALATLDIVEYEHVLIFDNITVFNDVIYVPELGNRQYRLKIVGQKTGSWTGSLTPAGFIYNSSKVDTWQPGKDYPLGSLVEYKSLYYTAASEIPATTTFNPSIWTQISSSQLQSGLLPNFSYNAAKFKHFNDLTDPELQGDFKRFIGTEIGFRPRQYLTDFGIDLPTQAKFYQGFIRQKGTMNSITAFTAAGFNGVSSNINIYEEWAMRVGEYGAIDNNEFFELKLVEGEFNGDPVTFTLLPNGATSANTISVYPDNLYLMGDYYTPNVYSNRDGSSFYQNDILTAGYVNTNDVDIQIFDMANFDQLNSYIDNMTVGTKIWTAKDNKTTSWNVYRVTETNLTVVGVTYAIDVQATVTVTDPHSFSYGDYVLIKGFNPVADGVYQVYNVINAFEFTIIVPNSNLTAMKSAGQIVGRGPIYTLSSLRLNNAVDISDITPLNGWMDGDKLWADHDQITGGWAVYNKSTPWTTANTSVITNTNMVLDGNSYITNSGFGSVTTINPTATFSAASIPTLNNGNVIVFVSNVSNNNTFTMVGNLGQRQGGTLFGASLASSKDYLFIGHPGNGTSQAGRVHIHKFDGDHSFPWTQTLTSPTTSNGDNFGYSVSTSDDSSWLFVGAPGVGNVYVYHASTSGTYTLANTIVGNSYVSSGNAITAQFGYTINTTSDGSDTIVGAPYERINGVAAAGAVYVFNRSSENFVSNGGKTYTTQFPITASTVKVTVNGNVKTSGFTTATNLVTFTNAPVVGTVVTVDTNKIQLLEKLTAPTPISGAAFGITSHISGNDADIYVASPGYSESGYHSGIVYRFVSTGANYGTITSNITGATVTVGDNFYINGFKVTFTNTDLANVAVAINSANISGVTATVQSYDLLTINSTVTTPFRKLIITPGPGNALANIGLSAYANVQIFKHPGTIDVSQFGSQITSNDDSTQLVISASRGSTYNPSIFDDNYTDFDNGATDFMEGNDGSGVVYVYGLVEGALSTASQDQYVLVQQLTNDSISSNDLFGSSIAMAGNVLLVGAPGDSNHVREDPVSGLLVNVPNSGTYYAYHNFSGNVGWDIIHSETPKVDIDSITRMYIYDKSTSTLLSNFDYIDPAKGKILGAAQSELDYITSYDPAVYNAVGGVDNYVPDVSYNADYHWGSSQVTRTWWDIGQVRYYDYEQGDLVYRSANWGATFPGSKIQVAEWVMSTVPPSQYKGSGQPLYADNSAYVVETYVDPATKTLKAHYFYWVINKTTLEPTSKNINSIVTIQDIIANPTAQDIPYAAALRDDTISLYNISNFLIGKHDDIVFHADYDKIKNNNIIHSEFQIIQEGRSGSTIPTRIVNKMIDSLSGVDILGNTVPDPGLSFQAKLGVGVRPNQTLFVDRLMALENFVQYVNIVLAQYPIVEEYNINNLYSSEAQPGIADYDLAVANHAELTYINVGVLLPNYTVLVTQDETNNNLWALYTWSGTEWSITKVQSYYTPFYWSFTDWYDPTYDSTVKVTYLVDMYPDLVTLSPMLNETAQVANRGNGQFSVYRYNGTTWDLVGLESGTVQLNDNLYTTVVAGNEIRIIFETIQNNIFVGNLKGKFNELFFFLVNYILTEQKSVDWIFKTSFITIFHQLRELIQYPSFIQDNQTYYEQYINEVKPYRTSIREYLIEYNGMDEFEGDLTDFDVPATYIGNVNAYRSPNGTISSDAYALANLPQYSSWYNNHGYGIASVTVTNPGTGYTIAPNVTVVGGGGTGASLVALIDPGTTSLVAINVVSPGRGYTSTPTIQINGTGTDATGYPTLISKQFIASVPTLDIVLDYPVSVQSGDIITQPSTGAYGTVYEGSVGHMITLKDIDLVNIHGTFKQGGYLYKNGIPLSVRPGISNTMVKVTGNVGLVPGDIIQQPTSGASGEVYRESIGNEISLWNTEGTFLSGGWLFRAGSNLAVYPTFYTISSNATPFSTYTSFVDQSYNLVRTFDTTLKFDRVSYTSNVKPWSKNDSYSFLSDFDQPGYAFDAKPYDTIISSTWVRYNGQGYSATGVVYSSATIKLNGNIVANIGDYVTQLNTEANAQIINISSNNSLLTVSNVTNNFIRRIGNIVVNGLDSNVVPVAVNNLFDYTRFDTIPQNAYPSAADRISALYQPSEDQPGLDLAQLMSGMSYPGTQVKGLEFNSNSTTITSNVVQFFSGNSVLFSSNIKQLDFTQFGLQSGLPVHLINSNVASKLKILTISPSEIRFSGIQSNIAIGSNVSLTYYDYNNPTYMDSIIQSSYGTITQQIILDKSLSGIYTGNVITQPGGNPSAQATIISSSGNIMIVSGGYQSTLFSTSPTAGNLYINSPLAPTMPGIPFDAATRPTATSVINDTQTIFGSRTEDINIDGGAYFDTYSSHAPEELVPGVTFDNLNIVVTTRTNGNTVPVSYRIVNNMNTNVAATDSSLWPQYYAVFDANTAVLTANLNITDGNIHVSNANVFMTPIEHHYPPIPGVVFINGEKITYWTVDRVNNVLGQIRRAVDGTGAPAVHLAGTKVVESGKNQTLPIGGDPLTGGNVHFNTWLNGPAVANAELIVDSSTGADITDQTNVVNLVRFSASAQEYLTLSSNITFAVGDVITQPTTGATGVVTQTIAQVKGNLGVTIGNTVAVGAAGIVGEFQYNKQSVANSYIWRNGANVVTQVTGISFSVTDGHGLEQSTTPQAQFILSGTGS